MRRLLLPALILLPATAAAELIYFSEHRAMSVASHRVEGERIIVQLRDGGEMTFDRSLVVRIAPDEVPAPPVPAPAAPAVSPAAAPALPKSTVFDALIERSSSRHGVDPRLVRAVIQVESGFRPRARSSKGALGLMQLMPATARHYRARPLDPASNIDAGVRHLKTLLAAFDLPEALAAYNAGEAAVRRFGGIPPYAETQRYVSSILRLLGSASRP